MGRSVESLSRATASMTDHWDGNLLEGTKDFWFECFEETLTDDEAYQRVDWDSEWYGYQNYLIEAALEAWPSMERDESWMPWPYRETTIVARNSHTALTVSEYCGIVQWSLLPLDDINEQEDGTRGLSIRWTQQVTNTFERLPFTNPLRPLGRFSDGTTAYERKA